MTARATALALALLLLAAGATAAPGACCPPSGSVEPAIRAADCCEAMLEGPTSPEATLAAAIAGLGPLQSDHALPGRPALVASFLRLPAAQGFLAAPPDGPPLYRLHSQLLI